MSGESKVLFTSDWNYRPIGSGDRIYFFDDGLALMVMYKDGEKLNQHAFRWRRSGSRFELASPDKEDWCFPTETGDVQAYKDFLEQELNRMIVDG